MSVGMIMLLHGCLAELRRVMSAGALTAPDQMLSRAESFPKPGILQCQLQD